MHRYVESFKFNSRIFLQENVVFWVKTGRLQNVLRQIYYLAVDISQACQFPLNWEDAFFFSCSCCSGEKREKQASKKTPPAFCVSQRALRPDDLLHSKPYVCSATWHEHLVPLLPDMWWVQQGITFSKRQICGALQTKGKHAVLWTFTTTLVGVKINWLSNNLSATVRLD